MVKQRVTMQDVAKAANVTPQTVSRALNNAPDISEEMRGKILRIAEELHYVKNNTASSLRCGSSRLVVVIYDALVNVYFSVMLDYLQTALRERGYSMLALSVAEQRLNRRTYEFAVSRNAEGIISFLEPEEELSAFIKGFSIPILLVGRRTEEKTIDYLRTDDEEGGRLAARRLLARGCKRPLYLTVDLSVSCAFDRFRGFEEEFLKTGICPRVLVDDGNLKEKFKELFEADPPDGIFCFNDMLAFDALFRMEQHALPFVNLIGFDAVQNELHIPYRLTSVGTDKRAMADRAVRLLIERIGGSGGEKKAETLPVSLFVGITA